jgi:hypothetical protein
VRPDSTVARPSVLLSSLFRFYPSASVIRDVEIPLVVDLDGMLVRFLRRKKQTPHIKYARKMRKIV